MIGFLKFVFGKYSLLKAKSKTWSPQELSSMGQ